MENQLFAACELITSSSNPRLKKIKALRHRKERQESGSYYVEGIRLVAEALQMGAPVETLLVAPELLTSQFAQNLVLEQIEQGVPCLHLGSRAFEALSSKDGPQGLGAVLQQNLEPIESVEPEADQLWVALEAVQDPGNLGTIIRTADAVGCAGLILIGDTTDPYDQSAVRGSMGSIFSLRLVRTNLSEFLHWKKRTGIHLIGTSGSASSYYRETAYQTPMVILSGSEREGLTEQAMEACDALVKIPMVGRCDSLNLAVATSVVLYEVFAQTKGAK